MIQPYSTDDYATALRRLLPRGRVWSAAPGTVQSVVLEALAQMPARLDADAVALLVDVFPTTTVNLVEEWESSLGLPDPCLGADPTLAQRRAQIRARITAAGGPTKAAIISYAEALGFEISIDFFAPFRAGRSRVGQPLCGTPWAHAWIVTILSAAGSLNDAAFRVGQNRAGDPLNVASAALTTLACELRRIMPAHTVLLISH